MVANQALKLSDVFPGAAPGVAAAPRLDEVDIDEARALQALGEVVLVDVREPEEFVEEHIPGALHMPLSQFDPESLLLPAKPVVLLCLSGGRSAKAAACLMAAGFGDTRHLRGGLLAWKAAGGVTKSALV
jgi:rhodanese-related sulfurtransferase